MIEITETQGVLHATIPDPGPTGRRQVGYAVHADQGRFLVRLPGRLATPVGSRAEAVAALRGDLPAGSP